MVTSPSFDGWQDGQLCSLSGIQSRSLSFFVVITLVVRSLEVLVDVGERGGTKVVVGHCLCMRIIQLAFRLSFEVKGDCSDLSNFQISVDLEV